MKRKILFCGGSHLAHAKEAIDDSWLSEDKSLALDYVVTAGVGVRKQLLTGEQFKFTKERGMIPLPVKINTMESFFPDNYECIVIVGNYFLPSRLTDYIESWHRLPMTDSIVKEIICHSFYEIPYKSKPFSFKSNFIELLAANTFNSKILFVPDPRVPNIKIPADFSERYYKYLQEHIENLGIHYIPHNKETYSNESGAGLEGYLRNSPSDKIHMNQSYWHKQIAPVLEYISQLPFPDTTR